MSLSPIHKTIAIVIVVDIILLPILLYYILGVYIPNQEQKNQEQNVGQIRDISSNQYTSFPTMYFSGDMYQDYDAPAEGSSIPYQISVNEEYIPVSVAANPQFKLLSGTVVSEQGAQDLLFSVNSPIKIEFAEDVIVSNLNRKFFSWEQLIISKINTKPRFFDFSYKYWNFTQQQKFILANEYSSSSNLSSTEHGVYSYSHVSPLYYEGKISLNGFKRSNNDMQVYLLKELPSDKDLLNTEKRFYPVDFDLLGQKGLSWDTKTEFLKEVFDSSNGFVDKSSLVEYQMEAETLNISFHDLEKSMWYTLIVYDWYNPYVIHLTTTDDIKEITNKNLATRNYGEKVNNYHICVNQPLDQEKTLASLIQSIGSGSISVAFSQWDNNYSDLSAQNNCVLFYYFLDPTKEFTYKPVLYSIYGQDITTEVKIVPHEIPNRYKYVSFIGNKYNLIPKNSYWWPTLQFAYKNFQTWTVYISDCQLAPQNFMKKLSEYNWDMSSDYTTSLLYDCKKPISKNLTFSGFAWWKEKVDELNISSLFDGKTPDNVGVSFDESMDNAKYFNTSNIWLHASLTDKELYWYLASLDNWMPLSGSHLRLYWASGSLNTQVQLLDLGEVASNGNVELPKDFTFGILVASNGNDTTFTKVSLSQWLSFSDPNPMNYYGKYFQNDHYLDKSQLGIPNYWGWNTLGYKLYGYTDRVLYKPGDTVEVAGWLRNLDNVDWSWSGYSSVLSGAITVSLMKESVIQETTINIVDEFGWFSTGFVLPTDWQLGTYTLVFSYQNPQTGEMTSYNSYFNIEEYAKPSFFLSFSQIDSKWIPYVRVAPRYYFGQSLQTYDIQAAWTYIGNSSANYDWTWCGQDYCDQPVYYNKVWWPSSYSGFNYSIKNFSWDYFDLKTDVFNDAHFGSVVVDFLVKDNLTKESSFKTYTTTIFPEFVVWLKSWDYIWHWIKDGDLKIDWVLKQRVKQWLSIEDSFEDIRRDKLSVKIYYKSFDNKQEMGPDWEYYNTSEDSYSFLKEEAVEVQNSQFSYNLVMPKEGKYFLRYIYTWVNNVVYENQQTVLAYNDSFSYYWDMPNNIKLSSFIKDKEYQPNEDVIVDIEPYIKDTWAMVYVQQWTKIIEQNLIQLDGKPISLKAKESWYPNAYIHIVNLVWEDKNNEISSNRKEPRFFTSYIPITISPKVKELTTDIVVTDLQGNQKERYSPWETIKISLFTKDYTNQPVDTRISVGVVDKAILDIYDELRKPMEYFYNKFWDFVESYSNLKYLYKALKVFSTDWTKWWWWGTAGGWLFNTRKNFLDVAYWSGWIITKDGTASFEVTLPDNLTTWVIDTISLSKSISMGTQRKEIIVSKPTLLDAQVPEFIGPFDNASIYVKILSQNQNAKDVQFKSWYSVGTTRIEVNNAQRVSDNTAMFNIDISSLDRNLVLSHDFVLLHVEASVDWQIVDAQELKIPIKKEWLEQTLVKKLTSSWFKNDILIPDGAKKYSLGVAVSLLPVAGIQKSINFLLHYPYWCTEQQLSWLLPAILAKDLNDKWILEQGLVEGDQILINGSQTTIDNLIKWVLSSIKANQKVDGWMWYWSMKEESSNAYLSVYTYGTLKYLQSLGKQVDVRMLDALQDYIKQSSDPLVILMSYLYQTQAGTQLKDFELAAVEKNTTDDVEKILAFSIYAYNWSKSKAESLKQINKAFIDSLYNSGVNSYGYQYYPYFDNISLTAYFVKGLVKLWDIKTAWDYVQKLIDARDERGLWWWSTQSNVQAMQAIAEFVIASSPQSGNFDLTIDGKLLTWSLSRENLQEVIKMDIDKNVPIQFNSSIPLNIEITLNYFLESMDAWKDSYSNVSKLELVSRVAWTDQWNTVSETDKTLDAGWIVDYKWSFALDREVQQLAVSFPIAANYSILNPSLGQQNYGWSYDSTFFRQQAAETIVAKNQATFNLTNTNWYSCYPSYYEVKYDRLFLYYNNLPKWASCSIEFKATKTHNWSFVPMPVKLFEMYAPYTWATVFQK